MLDNILNALKGQVGDIVSNSDASADKIDDILSLSGESVKDGLMKEAMGGNLDGVLNLFKGNAEVSNSNPIVSGITSMLTSKLSSSLNLGDGTAANIAEKIIPMILQAVVSKFNDKGGEPSADGIASFLGGADMGGMLGKAKGMLGGLFK